jgi:hypothetical protein
MNATKHRSSSAGTGNGVSAANTDKSCMHCRQKDRQLMLSKLALQAYAS